MPKETRNDLVVSIVFVLLSIGVVIATRDYPVADREVGVRSFPLILAIVLGVLSLLLLIKSVRTIRSGDTSRRETKSHGLDRTTVIRISVTIGSIALYVALVRWLGFILTSVVYLAVVCWYFGERRPGMVALFSVIGVLAVYLLFGVLAGVPFPEGPVERLLNSVGLV